MEEQRKSQRQRTFKGGSISYVGGLAIDCVIRNLSETGACLELNNSVVVPDNFTLIVKPEILSRSCHVVWRSAKRIGVSFS